MPVLSEQWALLPRWNLPPEIPLPPGSRDPLGFQRYATRFADHLLPNLTVLTNRARYYSFISWTLDEIAGANESRLLAGDAVPFSEYSETVARFERFLAFAEAAQHERDSSACSWVGQRKSRSLVRSSRKSLPLDVSLTVHDGSNGALADYRQSMLALGLLSEQPGQLPDSLTDDGAELADAFRKAIQTAKANRIRDRCLDLSSLSISRGNLAFDSKLMCLSLLTKQEVAILRPKLLGGQHEATVGELKPLLGKKQTTEPVVLKQYLSSGACDGVAFELKQAAVYQALALACLSLFAGVRMGLENVGQERKLTEILADQLRLEGIPSQTTLGRLAKGIRGVQEIESLDRPEQNESGRWIKPSIRLIRWLGQKVRAQPALVTTEVVDSVSLPGIVAITSHDEQPIDEVLYSLTAQLIADHQRVFLSKYKRAWLRLDGSHLRLDEKMSEPPPRFPPNTLRLGSLISVYRDLRGHNG